MGGGGRAVMMVTTMVMISILANQGRDSESTKERRGRVREAGERNWGSQLRVEMGGTKQET